MTLMQVYEFICKTPQGKEIRGECRAKNADDLEVSLRGTGLTLIFCQKKLIQPESTVATQAFVNEVAIAIRALKEPRRFTFAHSGRDRIQSLLITLFFVAGGAVLYNYLDSRIHKLEQLTFVQQVEHHNDLQE